MFADKFTTFHVLLSFAGLATGLIVAIGLLYGKRLDGWTAVFLSTTVATSVTAFGFASTEVLPSHIVGVISLIVLAVAIYARYARHLAGPWRWIYVATAMIAFYLNTFVLVVQLFRKLPALHALAPTESEPPFAIAQGIVLLVFIALTIVAGRKFAHASMVPPGARPAF
jgi:hypothetical protein